MLLCLLGIFTLATFTLILLKTLFMKKEQPFLGRNPFLRQFSKVLLKFCYVTTSKDLAILDGKKTAIITVYFEDLIIFRVQP